MQREISERAKVSMYTEQTPAFQSVDALMSQFAENPFAFEVYYKGELGRPARRRFLQEVSVQDIRKRRVTPQKTIRATRKIHYKECNLKPNRAKVGMILDIIDTKVTSGSFLSFGENLSELFDSPGSWRSTNYFAGPAQTSDPDASNSG